MPDDATYYRMLENHELVERALYFPTAELAKVLGERLEEALEEPQD